MNRLTMTADQMGFMDGDKPFTWRGSLDWMAYGEYLKFGDDDARKLFVDRRSVGANTVVTAPLFLWHDFTQTINFEKLPRYVDIAKEESMRVCVVCFCTTEQLMPSQADQKANWERYYVTLGDKDNVTLVLVNQPGYPDQRTFDPMAFDRTQSVAGFPPLLCARMNPGEDQNPGQPGWDFDCYCQKRDPWQGTFEVGYSMANVTYGYPPPNDVKWAGTRKASLDFETPHCKDFGEWADPGKWRNLARSLCFKGTAGGNFYSDQSAYGQVFTGVTRMCAVEFLGNIPTP